MSVSHPVFARLYARASVTMDRAGAAAHRRRLVAGLTGRVIEVGAGLVDPPTTLVRVPWADPSRIGWPLARNPQRRPRRRDRSAVEREVS